MINVFQWHTKTRVVTLLRTELELPQTSHAEGYLRLAEPVRAFRAFRACPTIKWSAWVLQPRPSVERTYGVILHHHHSNMQSSAAIISCICPSIYPSHVRRLARLRYCDGAPPPKKGPTKKKRTSHRNVYHLASLVAMKAMRMATTFASAARYLAMSS